MSRHFIWCLWALTGLALPGPLRAEPPNKNAYTGTRKAKLDEVLMQYDEAFRSNDIKKIKAAVEKFLPTRADGEKAFPKYSKLVGDGFEAFRKDRLDHLEEGVNGERKRDRGKLLRVDAIDLRKKEKPSEKLKRVLELIPKEIDVVDTERRYENNLTVGPHFLFVNERWVMVGELEPMAEVLAAIEKMEKEKK